VGRSIWTRVFSRSRHDVRLMNPKFVKPYVKSRKIDRNDAEAICEAVRRPNMRFVATKTLEQQELQMLHRMRQRLVRQHTTLVNQIRGLLHEYGIVMRQGVASVRRRLPEVLEDACNELTMPGRELVAELYDEWCALGERIEGFEERLKAQFRADPVCLRLAKIAGIGPVTATAVVATAGNTSVFDSGRGLAGWMGLVPTQYSTGGKTRLGSISKRGDRYLRTLLIHGARSVIQHLGEKQDRRSCWLRQLVARRGKNVASVALANKNARIIWALMAHDEDYRAA
jgi:transposase